MLVKEDVLKPRGRTSLEEKPTNQKTNVFDLCGF